MIINQIRAPKQSDNQIPYPFDFNSKRKTLNTKHNKQEQIPTGSVHGKEISKGFGSYFGPSSTQFLQTN